MSRRHAVMLGALALIWGASFMFIKVAVRELDPATLIAGRIGLGAITLALIVPRSVGGRRTLDELRRHWLVFTGIRLAGLGVGFVGVALIVGGRPEGELLGALAVVGMATCYAIGGLITGHRLSEASPQVVTLGTTMAATLLVAGPGAALAPHHVPGWKAIGSVVVLAVLGTAVAYLLFFALIQGAGFSRAALVTYLVPPIALAYGAIFLDESIGPAAIGGLALILGGVALASGRGRLPLRRAEPLESPGA